MMKIPSICVNKFPSLMEYGLDLPISRENLNKFYKYLQDHLKMIKKISEQYIADHQNFLEDRVQSLLMDKKFSKSAIHFEYLLFAKVYHRSFRMGRVPEAH